MTLYFLLSLLALCAFGSVLVRMNYATENSDAQQMFFTHWVLDGLVPLADRVSGTFTSDFVDLAARRGCIEVTLTATDSSGSPSLALTVEHSFDGITWATLGTMTAMTGPGTETKTFAAARRYLRFVGVLSGTSTPHLTYKVTGKAF